MLQQPLSHAKTLRTQRPEPLPRSFTPAPLSGQRFERLILEFTASAMARALVAFNNLNSAILFAATARACGPFDQGPRRRRPVSINALSASLGRPFETIRRHANAMAAQGTIIRTEAGLSVELSAIEGTPIAQFIDEIHDLLVRLVEDLYHGDFALPRTGADPVYDQRIGTGIALDLLLAAVECHGHREDNFTRLALLLAIEWAQVHHGLSTPYGMSEPLIRTSTIARVLKFPYATTLRNLESLTNNGLIGRSNGSLAALEEAPGALLGRTNFSNRARQLVGRLAQAGFPMRRPSKAYIHQRPISPSLS